MVKKVETKKALEAPRIMHLTKAVGRDKLVALVSVMIKDLQDFLEPSRKMSAKAIMDTAELIVDEYEVFSLDMIADCFRKVKTAKPPFDDEVYGALSGRKIMQWLGRYDQYVMDMVNREAYEKKAKEMESNIEADYLDKIAKRLKHE